MPRTMGSAAVSAVLSKKQDLENVAPAAPREVRPSQVNTSKAEPSKVTENAARERSARAATAEQAKVTPPPLKPDKGDSSDDEVAQPAQKPADSSDDEVAQRPAVTERPIAKKKNPTKKVKPASQVPAVSDPKQSKFKFRISVRSVGQEDPICQQSPVLPELGEDHVVGRFLFAPTAVLLQLWPGQVDVKSGGYVCKVIKYDKRTKIATLKFHDGTQYLKWDTLMSFKALS